MTQWTCRFCGRALEDVFCDLGTAPPSNSYLREDQLGAPETFFPLLAYVCSNCFLVQLPQFQTPSEIFSDYAYFSSYSQSWLKHAKDYVDYMMGRFKYDASSLVVEIASNDGYLLTNFRDRHVPVLGIEPAANVAVVAEGKGVPTRVCFFGEKTAKALIAEGKGADLLLGNNVLAHVPDLSDFVRGLKILLKPDGILTLEFPHLLRLIEQSQFDTIYHEHFSYFSFTTVAKLFAHHGITLFDVQQLQTHGGSIRIFGRHSDKAGVIAPAVEEMLRMERAAGLNRLGTYLAFGEKAQRAKRSLLSFLVGARDAGKSVVGYGAPAKGNTLLNYCGVRNDLVEYTVDISPHKQGMFLPGTRIPIFAPERISETRPDYVLILPWNLKAEISRQLSFVKEWGGQLVIPIPQTEVLT
jgi:2-polyprenyl-3-methyl-5-hydroxy-6-metoxy-1,4-benzoquinol methylase